MFVQVIEGKVSDKGALRRQFDQWQAELRPGANGFVGSTAGVSDDGIGFAIARFDSAQAARANSEREAQGAWWAETEKCFDGPVSFTDSEDVEEFLGGGSDDAGFVQVMKSPAGVDRAVVHDLDSRFEEHAATWRPDLVGGVRIWTDDSSTVEVNYFTSEAEARENEKKDPPPELAEMFAQFSHLMAATEFLDLREPWLY